MDSSDVSRSSVTHKAFSVMQLLLAYGETLRNFSKYSKREERVIFGNHFALIPHGRI